ncbi:hypothetical protein NEUTE1DRAFT_102248 [Neurospora tetrasperma FGSC 2508]|uniref:Uncharacterized protein n=1 Tax=Neurospora tetrasperma (strain FGSC 2508 / ATCC MYA-4615 / P0657) TaxID=510951 RepID=F8MNM7_NEUT8|nr:uncharacterized protein NEUTE1DRAFT_102248 [Neurospora tetrasperma FGSC 2508]EGO56995.1 hypothetical protein NEUTE1DRAFT_102248 [Neurospora tetrasperma FGSC 2508]
MPYGAKEARRTLARYQLPPSRQLAPATDHEAYLGDEKGNKDVTQAWRGRVGKHSKHPM